MESPDGRKAIGKYLRKLRIKSGLSMQQVSELLGYKSYGTVNAVERGVAALPIEKIFDYADIFKARTQDILDQLKVHDPEKYAKFMELEERFERRMLRKINKGYQSRNEVSTYRKASKTRAFGEYPMHDHNIHYRTLGLFTTFFFIRKHLKRIFGDRGHKKELSYSI